MPIVLADCPLCQLIEKLEQIAPEKISLKNHKLALQV